MDNVLEMLNAKKSKELINFKMNNIDDLTIKENEVDMELQFTTPSGLHSVLERPFSEANGRPFLVKRSPLIVC